MSVEIKNAERLARMEVQILEIKEDVGEIKAKLNNGINDRMVRVELDQKVLRKSNETRGKRLWAVGMAVGIFVGSVVAAILQVVFKAAFGS